jgi:hypothetical protein
LATVDAPSDAPAPPTFSTTIDPSSGLILSAQGRPNES